MYPAYSSYKAIKQTDVRQYVSMMVLKLQKCAQQSSVRLMLAVWLLLHSFCDIKAKFI